MTSKLFVYGILFLTLTGCQPSSINLPTSDPQEPVAANDLYEASRNGSLEGNVCWEGEVPVIPMVHRPISLTQHEAIPNPNEPRIDGSTNVHGALVMLRGVDARKSKSWPYPSVEVELHDRGITIHQGKTHGRYGIVRRGDPVAFRLNSERTLGVRGRGADFFSHILPPSYPRIDRVFARAGCVELASASGQFWASAELVVSDHPYVLLTDTAGKFHFSDVPSGQYELEVQVANWCVEESEIDPESGLKVRQRYFSPFQTVEKIDILPGTVVSRRIHLPVK